VERLTLETRLLRKEKVTSDKELEGLKQEKKAYKLEKENLVKERDEAKEAEGLLISKIQVLEATKHTLDGKVVEQKCTIEGKQREAESIARRLKNEREDFRDKSDKIRKAKATLEEENNNLKRKINNIKVECSSGDAGDEPPAKRPRTPQSAKRDSIPQGPRAMAGGSPDTPISMSISSPNDGRHRRFSGKEVRRVDVSPQNLYSSRW
jgi:chromosome segregation ATPase